MADTSAVASNPFAAANAAASASAPKAAAPGTVLGSDYTTFLKILTTQLQNQDPMSPLDTNQFTEQLVQFSQVEQQIGQNTKLDQLISLAKGGQITSALGFVGKTVEAETDAVGLSGGQATLSYDLPAAAKAVKVDILDSTGAVVRTLNGGVDEGRNRLSWDGRDDTGRTVADGAYTMSVTATDALGGAIAAQPILAGRVDGVTASNGIASLHVGSAVVGLDKVTKVDSDA